MDIYPPKGFLFQKDSFDKVFDYPWRKQCPSEFYAHFPSLNRWGFAIAADSPKHFDSLELAFPLADRWGETVVSVEGLEACLRELHVKLKQFGADFNVVPRETPGAAVAKAAAWKKLQRQITSEVVVVLQADDRYYSPVFWNMLVDLGLEWGDGDVFHWENSNRSVGGDSHFDVWTSTAPGYFLPEDVAAKTFQPKNLIFGFVIPRSADPERVFDMMLQAIGHFQKEWGGTLLNPERKPFDPAPYRAAIQETLSRMEEAGLTPGQGTAMRLF